MSQSVITTAFEQLKAEQAANGGILTLDEFVFANVPDLNITDPIDRGESWPAPEQIVHRQDVSKTGTVNGNAVVYSVVLGAETGDFDFNWIGLINKASNTVAMIVHAPVQKKIKTASGQQGNVLTRSFMMEYNGASQITQITTPADTWQIDFTARLAGMDERIRKENIDSHGTASFYHDGFLVSREGGGYSVKKGVGYVAGLRAELLLDKEITAAELPVKVWVDVCWKGLLTSVWSVETKVVVAEALNDYSDNGQQHYVFAIAEIQADGAVVDLRGSPVKPAQEIIDDFAADLEKKQPLNDNLTALSGMEPDGDMVPFFEGGKRMALAKFSALGRQLVSRDKKSDVLADLGLLSMSRYGSVLIGELVEWPREQMPQEIWPDMDMEFIPYMAQTFDPVKYPLLSQLHPANALPADMRAHVPRGWDNGRGIDTGRVLMSEQGDATRNITGTVGNLQFRTGGAASTGVVTGVFKMEASTVAGNSSAGVDPARVVGIDISQQVPTASEIRVKTVAWNFIVRAK